MLTPIFSSTPCAKQLEGLSANELKLLIVILERKLGRKEQSLSEEPESLARALKLVKMIDETPSLKRQEENYKFVFNYCIKTMKKKMKEAKNLTRSQKKKEVERIFYSHYFQEISERNQIPLENFYFPKNSFSTKVMKLNSHKSISGKYIEYIKMSH